MKRPQRVNLEGPGGPHIYVHALEDILLQKLRWSRAGGDVSDRQWRDVLGILTVQAGRLDEEYLKEGADVLGVSDLLARAQREVEGGG